MKNASQINWSNNVRRQLHLIDCFTASLLGAFLLLMSALWLFGAESSTMLFWIFAAFLVEVAVYLVFAAVQIAFRVSPRLKSARSRSLRLDARFAA